MKQVTQAEFNDAISSGISVVDFFATRCGPCKMIAPYLDEMEEKLEWKVQFYKVDVDQENQLAWAQWVTAMPTMKVFKDGQAVETIVGADLKWLRTAIQNHIA